jgi:hypothetical protein
MARVFFLSLFVILFFSGCNSIFKIFIPPKIYEHRYSEIEDKALGIDKLKCKEFENKKIFTHFTTTQDGIYFETYNIFSDEKLDREYFGNYADDFKNFFDQKISKYCGARIAKNKFDADIDIYGNIYRYYTQIADYKDNGKYLESKFNVNLNIRTQITSKNKKLPFYFDKTMQSQRDMHTDGLMVTATSIMSYDDSPIPFAFLSFSGRLLNTYGVVKRYDSEGKEILRIPYDIWDVGFLFNNPEVDKVVFLHDERGWLVMLMYKYIFDMVEYVDGVGL